MENPGMLRQLGENVRRTRKDRGLSLAEVSARMTALGVPLSLNGLSKVELGNRGLDLHELMALAKALEVPPLLLIFPLGKERRTQVLPGNSVGTWAAAKWFTGEEPFPVQMPDGKWAAADFEQWRDAPTAYFREQDAIFAEWNRAKTRVKETFAEGDEEGVRFAERMVQRVEDELRRHRALMRRVGLEPEELNAELVHIDDAGADDGQR